MNSEGDAVPAVVDMNTGMWMLHVKVGDVIDYPDESGGTFKIRIAGFLANSVLQGDLIISEKQFVKHFPSASGYRVFLIDSADPKATAAALSFALEDYGLELTPATRRLAEFSQVQNTYLDIFQALGGLALLLGSVGLGVVVSAQRARTARRTGVACRRWASANPRCTGWCWPSTAGC